jgi:parafibromin
MDALSALRGAIISGANIELKGPASDPSQVLVIDGVSYPVNSPTAFAKKSSSAAGGYYSLLAVWLQWSMRDMAFTEYLRVLKERNISTHFVMVVDKRALVEYLEGKGDGMGKIDQSKLTLAASTSGVAGSVSAIALACVYWAC